MVYEHGSEAAFVWHHLAATLLAIGGVLITSRWSSSFLK
jgi:hypothetical protein